MRPVHMGRDGASMRRAKGKFLFCRHPPQIATPGLHNSVQV